MLHHRPSRYWIIAFGAVAIASAWYARRVVVSEPPRTSSRTTPQQEALTAQAGRLLDAIKTSPRKPELRWQLADVMTRLGRIDVAAAQLATADELDPRDRRFLLSLAAARLNLKQLAAAEAAYRAATVRWPRELSGWQGLSAALYHEQRYFEAMNAAQQAVRLSPRDAASHYLLATAALEYGMEYPDRRIHKAAILLARSELSKLHAKGPQQGDFYYRMGLADIGLEKWSDAIDHLNRATGLLQTSPVYRSLAAAYLKSGKIAQALAATNEGLHLNARDELLHDIRGQALQKGLTRASLVEAAREFQKALQLEPTDAGVQERFGSVCVKLGRLPEARKAFEAASSLDPNRELPLQELSALYSQAGEDDRATAAVKQARSDADTQDRIHHDIQEALAHPADITTRLSLADALRTLGMGNAARDEYLLALQSQPENRRAIQGLRALAAAGSASVPNLAENSSRS